MVLCHIHICAVIAIGSHCRFIHPNRLTIAVSVIYANPYAIIKQYRAPRYFLFSPNYAIIEYHPPWRHGGDLHVSNGKGFQNLRRKSHK